MRLLLPIMLLLFPIWLPGQLPDWQHFSALEYPHRIVIEDNIGWLAGRGGVWRIDFANGEAQEFNQVNSNLTGNDFRAIQLGADGNVWLYGKDRESLFRFDGTGWTTIETGYGFHYGTDMTALPDGSMVLFRTDTSTLQIDLVRYGPDLSENILQENIYSLNSPFENGPLSRLRYGPDNSVWYSKHDELRKVTDSGLVTFNASNSPLVEGVLIRNIIIDDQSRVYVLQHSTDETLITHRYDPSNGTWVTSFPTDLVDIDDVSHYHLYPNGDKVGLVVSQNQYFLSTEDGNWTVHDVSVPSDLDGYFPCAVIDESPIVRIRKEGLPTRIMRYTEDGETQVVAIDDTRDGCGFFIGNILVDHDCQMWVRDRHGSISSTGLDWLEFKAPIADYFGDYDPTYFETGLHTTSGEWYVKIESRWNIHPETLLRSDDDGQTWVEEIGLGYDPYLAQLEEDYNGTLWCVSNGDIYRREAGIWEFFHNGTHYTGLTLAPSGDIWAITTDSDYVRLPFGTSGAYHESIPFTDPDDFVLTPPAVDREGRLVFEGEDGLVVRQNQTYSEIPYPADVHNPIFRSLIFDEDNNYWLTSSNDLLKFDGQQWTAFSGAWETEFAAWVGIDSLKNVRISMSFHPGDQSTPIATVVFNENGVTQPHKRHCLSGTTYYDVNQNAEYNPGDLPLPNMSVLVVPDSVQVFSDYFGRYRYEYDTDSTVLVQSHHDATEWILVSDSLSYHASDTSTAIHCAEGYDFGYVSVNPVAADATIHLDLPFARCFEESSVKIHVWNNSFLNSDLRVALVLPDTIDVTGFSIEPDYSMADTLFWDLSLEPYSTHTHEVYVTFPDENFTALPFDFYTHVTTQSDPDQILDEDVWSDFLLCSYDPNDIMVNSPGIYSEDRRYCLPDSPLDYQIRFENTGNDTAFQVRIESWLPPELEAATFEVLNSSHPCVTTLTAGGKLSFVFAEIDLLPSDSLSDPAIGHGFVRFRAHTRANLPESTLVSNRALIYFDYNAPIITNVAEVIFQTPTISSTTDAPLLASLQVSPNPAQTQTTITGLPNKETDLTLTDISGRERLRTRVSGPETQLEVGGLPAGVYMVRVAGRKPGRVVVVRE